MGMDYEKQKRTRMLKVIVTEVIMVAMIAALVAVLMLVVSGYRINDDMELEQSGLVQINSLPTGATIEIDGEKISARTNSNRLLKEGEHTVRLSKSGYDTWEKQIEVTPGWLLRLRYARLFKKERTVETVQTLGALELMSVAPSRNKVLYAKDNSTTWQLLTLRGDVVAETELNLAAVFGVEVTEEEVPVLPGRVEELKWSENGNRVLVRVAVEGAMTWVLVDTSNVDSSVNLTRELGLNLIDVQFSSDAGDKLLVLESANLREVNVSGRETSRVLLSGVAEFFARGNDVIFTTFADAEGARVVGFYRAGEQNSVTLRDLTGVEGEVRVALTEYFNEKYLVYTLGAQFYIYKGENFPTAEDGVKSLKKVVDGKEILTPTGKLTVSKNGEFVMARGAEAQLMVLDAETDKYYAYQAPSSRLQFLDNYLLMDVVEGKLIVWDFDNTNQRTLADAASYPAFISENNHYLYYMALEDELLTLKRERL